MRVLHLVDILPGTDGRHLHRLVRRTLEGFRGHGEHVLLEVGGGDRRQPCLPGTAGRLTPVRSIGGGLAGEQLWRVLEAWGDVGRQFDLIHCWGDVSLRLRAACVGGPPTCCTLDSVEIDAPLVVDVLELSNVVPLEIQVGSSGMANAMHTEGLDHAIQVVPFGFQEQPSGPDSLRRAAWGADDQTLVFGLVGDRIHRASLQKLIGVPVRLAVVGDDVRVIASKQAGGFEGSRRWLGRMGREEILVPDDVAEAGMSSIDIALAPGSTGRCGEIVGLLPILEALVVCRPVLIGDGHPAASDLSVCEAVFPQMDLAETDAARWSRERMDQQGVDAGALVTSMANWCGQLVDRYAVLAE